MARRAARFVCCLASLVVAFTAGSTLADGPSAGPIELRAARKALAQKPRGIIFNNDGCDVLHFPAGKPITTDNLLELRTTALADSQVGAIAYCTISSGFSNFTHRTEAGHFLTAQPSGFDKTLKVRNIAQDLAEQGTDCLEVMVRFAHAHRQELFWSMRMNDTHDVAYRPDKPYLLYPKLKLDHPDWLVGDWTNRTKRGRWSSVDYARPEIRALALSYLEEVCRKYDIDGVELDFFRHLCYFKSTAHGGKATPAECDMMTDFVGKVRAMTEHEGLRRGRPILVSVRVPDSLEYCRDMGFDLKRWLANGMVDLLMTTCYFRLNPWSYSVQLGHAHGVPVYPCLSDSRVTGEDRFHRASVESYRGRAINAWNAGADGMHVFNQFNPKSPVWRELGDPKTLAPLAKLYFVTVRDGDPNTYLDGGAAYSHLPWLTPQRPALITPGKPLEMPIEIGDDPAAAPAGRPQKVTMHLWLPRLRRAEDITLSINGKPLPTGQRHAGWLDCALPPGSWRKGVNTLKAQLAPSAASDSVDWSIAYEAKKLPSKPWTRDRVSARTVEQMTGDGLLLADRGTSPGDYLYYRNAWGASPDSPTVVEAKVKVVSGTNCVILTNGSNQMRLELHPDFIGLWGQKDRRYAMNTTDSAHTYRIETANNDIRIFVDGVLRIDAAGRFRGEATPQQNYFSFGAANSDEVGEACWSFVRARLTNQVCQDIVVRVEP